MEVQVLVFKAKPGSQPACHTVGKAPHTLSQPGSTAKCPSLKKWNLHIYINIHTTRMATCKLLFPGITTDFCSSHYLLSKLDRWGRPKHTCPPPRPTSSSRLQELGSLSVHPTVCTSRRHDVHIRFVKSSNRGTLRRGTRSALLRVQHATLSHFASDVGSTQTKTQMYWTSSGCKNE